MGRKRKAVRRGRQRVEEWAVRRSCGGMRSASVARGGAVRLWSGVGATTTTSPVTRSEKMNGQWGEKG